MLLCVYAQIKPNACNTGKHLFEKSIVQPISELNMLKHNRTWTDRPSIDNVDRIILTRTKRLVCNDYDYKYHDIFVDSMIDAMCEILNVFVCEIQEIFFLQHFTCFFDSELSFNTVFVHAFVEN